MRDHHRGRWPIGGGSPLTAPPDAPTIKLPGQVERTSAHQARSPHPRTKSFRACRKSNESQKSASGSGFVHNVSGRLGLVFGKDGVKVTAFWGNDDAESTVELSREAWERVKRGGRHVIVGQSAYEGRSESVAWSFEDRCIWINGNEGAQHINGDSIESLVVEE